MVSACLEHSSVRFDGTMISDEVVRKLKEVVDFTAICPEVAIGMTAPRDAVRLVQRKGEELKLLSSIKGADWTDKMNEFTSKYIANLKKKEWDGFIVKAKSPSCGIKNVKIYQDIGKAHVVSGKNRGMFGGALEDAYADYPIETERRLSNFLIRENFYIQIFTRASFRDVKESGKIRNLVKFHSDNKYLFMTYHQNGLRRLGNIVANHTKETFETVVERYEIELVSLFQSPPTSKKRLNVLTHIYGYYKEKLSQEEKDYYFETQEDYLQGHLPYSSPLRILKGFAIRFNERYLMDQTIYEPYPKSLIVQLDSGKMM